VIIALVAVLILLAAVRLAAVVSPPFAAWAERVMGDPATDWTVDLMWWAELIVFLLAALALTATSMTCHADTPRIPVRADGYSKLLEREAVHRFGLSAPVALLAAQLHQESHWRADARSPYAQGLAQFTPDTAAWIPGVCADIGPPNVWDARWSIRAQACYMRWLHGRISDTATPCDRWAMVLSAYNGGLGWVIRDRALASASGADRSRWFDHVERYSQRAAWAIKENRDYPRRILHTLEPVYLAAGWPGRRTCTE
jgi:soluble lytic murein transglycosylase-like protein